MDKKPWYSSLTIWAAAAVGFLQGVPDLINEINVALPGLHLAANPLVLKVLSIIGVIVAIYGRLIAKSTLTPVKPTV